MFVCLKLKDRVKKNPTKRDIKLLIEFFEYSFYVVCEEKDNIKNIKSRVSLLFFINKTLLKSVGDDL